MCSRAMNTRPSMVRLDCGRCCIAWGVEPVMSRAEQEGLAYLFRLRMTANVKRALTKMMAERDWTAAGHGWQGKETTLRLIGWSRQRRVVLLRRKLERPLVLVDRTQPEQPRLGFGRGRTRSRGVGIRRVGDLAGRRDPHAGPAVPRSRRL